MIELSPGLTASLGTLRAQHQLRMERFAAAAALGDQVHLRLRGADKRSGDHKTLTLLSMGPAAYDAVPWTGVAGSKWAPDYTAFCKAAKASICLYVPKSDLGIGQTLAPAGGSFTDIDMLITDKGICSEEDGTLYVRDGVALGCLFFYPFEFNVQYFAGNPPSATVSTKNCPSKGFSTVVDPHGGAAVSWNKNFRRIPWGGSSPATITCAIPIRVPSGQPKPLPTPIM